MNRMVYFQSFMEYLVYVVFLHLFLRQPHNEKHSFKEIPRAFASTCIVSLIHFKTYQEHWLWLKNEFGFKLQKDLKHKRKRLVNYSVHCFYTGKGHKLSPCVQRASLFIYWAHHLDLVIIPALVCYVFDFSELKPCVLVFVVLRYCVMLIK